MPDEAETSSTGVLRVTLVPGSATRGSNPAKVAVLAQGKVVQEADVDATGTASFTLAPGTYQVKLQTPPPGFIGGLSDPSEVPVQANGTASARIPLIAVGSLRITVFDTEGKPVEGANFEVKRADTAVASATSDKVGVATATGLVPGDYVVTQKTAGKGHLLPDPANQTKPIPDPPGAEPVPVPFVNQTAGSIHLLVVDEDAKGVKSGLPGAMVAVRGPKEFAQIVSTVAGDTFVHDLAPGSYTLEETTPPAGYSLPDATTQTVVLQADSDPKKVTFGNRRLTPVQAATSWGATVSWTVVTALVVLAVWAACHHDWDLTFAGAVTAVGLALVSAIGGRRGFFHPLIGGDGRVSTSKVQVAIWTGVLVWTLSYLGARVVLADHLADTEQPKVLDEDGKPKENPSVDQRMDAVLPEKTWDDYLILLGGPFAAAVLAKGVVSRRVEDGRLQKTAVETPTVDLRDAFKNDAENTDLVDSQYLLFNVVALAYFAVRLATTPELPTIPPTMLALTSGAAALYVGNKAVETNAPSITGVVPATARPGEKIAIRGRNLCVAGTTSGSHATVDLEGVGRLQVVAEKSECVEAVLPAHASTGVHDLTVTTPAGVTTEPWSIRVEADQARIISVRGWAISSGEPLVVVGTGFRSPLAPLATTATVWIDDRFYTGTVASTVTAAGETLDEVVVTSFDVPAQSSAAVAVQSTMGARSLPMTVAVRS